MLVKQLTQSGNSKAIILDKSLLTAAGLDEDALFGITINPNGGLTIQSLETTDPDLKKAAFKKVMEKHRDLLKRLSDR